MAPRKIKTQGKRNVMKIKSKSIKENRAFKALKKNKKHENSLENLKWLNKISDNKSFQKDMPRWLHEGTYKLKVKSSLPGSNVSESEVDSIKNDVCKYSASETSEECNCKYSDKIKNGILRPTASTSSAVSNYIKSGMDQVASFIVESAIRFGEQHGVIVPDKNNPHIYEFTPTNRRSGEKFRKIRFKIPDKSPKYKETKKLRRRSDYQKEITESPLNKSVSRSSNTWRQSRSDSIDKVLPILKKMKQDVNFNKNNIEVEKLSGSEDCYHDRERERAKERYRKRGKRHKSLESFEEMGSDKYSTKGCKWRKFRCDSIELGKQRLRALTSPRDHESMSQKSC